MAFKIALVSHLIQHEKERMNELEAQSASVPVNTPEPYINNNSM